MITVTDRAQRHLEIARASGEIGIADLRVVVRRGALGHIEYVLHWVKPGHALPGDLVAQCGPIRVHVEIHSAAFLRDATLDYLDGADGRGFRLEARHSGA